MAAQKSRKRKAANAAQKARPPRRRRSKRPTKADFRRLARNVAIALVGGGVLYLLLITLSSPNVDQVATIEEYHANRAALDEEYWDMEVLAQDYETVIIEMWDDLRERQDKYRSVRDFPLKSVRLPAAGTSRSIEHNIQITDFAAPQRSLELADWQSWLDSLHAAGWRIKQAEWHHKNFEEDDAGIFRSRFSSELHVNNLNSGERIIVKALLEMDWLALGQANQIEVVELQMISRSAAPLFAEMALPKLTGLSGRRGLGHVICADINQDNFVDILVPNLNTVLLNKQGQSFERGRLCSSALDRISCALYADFDADGIPELLCGGFMDKGLLGGGPANGTMQPLLVMYTADSSGAFSQDPRIVFSAPDLAIVTGLTSGDVNGDGFADVWLSQYKPPYEGGQMPTPYYDANDGYPSYLLINIGVNGHRVFEDGTAQAGLAEKRFRRTYAASIAELDGAPGLDLLLTSDFAGVDLFSNRGDGTFEDRTAALLNNPKLFGMAHCLADLNNDGATDLLAIGMSSTTAKRLHAMNAGLPGFDDLDSARLAMAHGNRLFMRQPGGAYQQAPVGLDLARTGWSWGCADLDFDNDGDADVYIANGHDSKSSARDYCTHFWRDDIYRGTSDTDSVMDFVYRDVIRGRKQEGISWNPFEKNHLFLNRDAQEFVNVAFLMGVALEEDSRSVAAADFDNDGLMDILVSSLRYKKIDKLRVYHNRGTADTRTQNWIGLDLEGHAVAAVPGVVVKLYSGGAVQSGQLCTGDSFATQSAARVHFGLGAESVVDSLVALWPDGRAQRLVAPGLNRWHKLTVDVPL